MTILIREARPEELNRIEALAKEAYREFRPLFPERVWNSWMDNIAQTIRSPAGMLLVAEEAGEIHGVVKFYPDAAQSGMGQWPKGSAAIRIFAVRPQSRGRGCGIRLTMEVLRRAREMGVSTIFLYTGEFMHAARHIYEELGFRRAPEFDRQPGPIAYRLDLD
ncbi:MAG: GNAT family N-acetyltransferase [Deltaproteobacteria bacterium]|nr:GNAT family N-acetyltransferase [Deltaproteobacteria bacterium]